MKATRLLEEQHRQARDLFEAIEGSNATNRRQLVGELITALAAHMVIEEETFYPMTLNIRREQVQENQEEHDLAAIEALRAVVCQADDRLLMARVRVLRTLIEGHVAKEETDLFPAVEAALDDATLQAMGQQMENRFHQMIKLSPQAVLAARPTAGMKCPGQPQPAQQQPNPQQPTKGQTAPKQPCQQKPGKPTKGRGGPGRAS